MVGQDDLEGPVQSYNSVRLSMEIVGQVVEVRNVLLSAKDQQSNNK